jgi:hypothetical protein
MSAYLFLPLLFLRFWFLEAPLSILRYFASLNRAVLHFLSLPLFLRTFFKPLKNEYRQGLVGFSIGMGIAVKSVLILFDLAAFAFILILEVVLLTAFLLVPFATIGVLFL